MKKIISCGHDIGLHFDEMKYITDEMRAEWSADVICENILEEKNLLQGILGMDISAVSMHRPTQMTLDADLKIPWIINSYGKAFFKDVKYVSDSYHRWRENVWKVIESHPPVIQLLTHPFWYHDEPKNRTEAFEEFISGAGKRAAKQLEDNILPPNTTLRQSIEEDNTAEGV